MRSNKGQGSTRRQFLRTSAGVALGVLVPLARAAEWGRVAELSGEVLLNGKPLERNAAIQAGQTITTGRDGHVWFTLAGDAYFLRPGSELALRAAGLRDTLVDALRLFTGALGASFAHGRERDVLARTVTIGVRGTALYVETNGLETYACTCFGTTELMPPGGGDPVETVKSVHHSARIIRPAEGPGALRVEPAPFERHTDEEIVRLQRLVGRTDPFPA